MGEVFKRPYRVRRAALRGKEITLPPESSFRPGDDVIQFFDGFVLIVPKGAKVDEVLLSRAIQTGPGQAKGEEANGTPQG